MTLIAERDDEAFEEGGERSTAVVQIPPGQWGGVAVGAVYCFLMLLLAFGDYFHGQGLMPMEMLRQTAMRHSDMILGAFLGLVAPGAIQAARRAVAGKPPG